MANENYRVAAEGVNPDRALMAFGDLDPSTLPGAETEDGDGITKISDFIEDFSYTAAITSTIDGRSLGALHWVDGALDNWDSQEELEKVIYFYVNGTTNWHGTGWKII